MQQAAMRLLFDYTYWANGRIEDAAAGLTPAQLTQPTGADWGSLRGVLVHMLDTEYGWRVRCQAAGPSPILTEEDYPTLAAIRARWGVEQAAMHAFLDSLTDLEAPITYRAGGARRQRPVWHVLFHIVNHSTQHRSECAAMLTAFGHSPGAIDFTTFQEAGA